MPSSLPTASDDNETGRRGVTKVQDLIEGEGWLFRRQDGDTDFGIDAEIELTDRRQVTGRILKAQIKASQAIGFKAGEASVSVKTVTYNLWRNTPLPTILFYVDVPTGGVYWTPALAHSPRAGAASLSVRFEEDSDLRDGLTGLRGYLMSWFVTRDPDAILREVPLFYRIYAELAEDIDHYDDPMEMGEEQDGQFRLLYGHVLRLRLEMGLRNEHLPTLDDWYARNVGMWKGDVTLSWAVFSEAMKVTGPAYKEATDRMRARIKAAPEQFEHLEIINFMRRLDEPDGRVPIIYLGEEASEEQHRRIEANLKSVGGLRFSYFERRK